MQLRQIFDKDGKAAQVWNSPWVGVPLWVVSATLTELWWRTLPTPGKAIGALAVVAGIMSVRDVKVLGRISWIGLLICLLVTEFRAIDKDHADSDERQRVFFDTQKKGFESISTQAQTGFRQTAQGLQIAIDGLGQSLKATKETFKQTRPYAVAHFSFIGIENLSPDFFRPGVDYIFNFSTLNDGNDIAKVEKTLLRVYVAKPDDLAVQSDLAKHFDADWQSKKAHSPVDWVPHLTNGFVTEKRTFSADEVSRLGQLETIYVIGQVKYSDSTGAWLSTICENFQKAGPLINVGVYHPCPVVSRDRYPLIPPTKR